MATYTSKIGKRTYILYKQTEGPWADKPYGSGGAVYGTVGYCGCPTTACATAVSGFKSGAKLTPEDFRKSIANTTVSGGLSSLGFNVTYHGGPDNNTIISELKKRISCNISCKLCKYFY